MTPLTESFAPIPAAATIALGRAESEAIEKAAAELLESEARLDSDEFLTKSSVLAHRLPMRLLERLIDFRRNSNAHGTLLLRNLPLGEVPASPSDGRGPQWPDMSVSTASLALPMALLGEILGYADEKEGRLIQDIAPISGAEARQENSGSVFLEFHTEDGFHPHRPDFLGLLCLRSDHEQVAATATSSILRALPLLSGSEIAALREPLYRIRLSSSFSASADSVQYASAAPVLTGDLLAPTLCVDFHATEPLSDSAAWALERLKEAMTQTVVGAVLAPGDLILVDNRVAAHARTGFTPHYDGSDRWLRRMFAVSDLRASGSVRPRHSRVCAPLSLYLRPHAAGLPAGQQVSA